MVPCSVFRARGGTPGCGPDIAGDDGGRSRGGGFWRRPLDRGYFSRCYFDQLGECGGYIVDFGLAAREQRGGGGFSGDGYSRDRRVQGGDGEAVRLGVDTRR